MMPPPRSRDSHRTSVSSGFKNRPTGSARPTASPPQPQPSPSPSPSPSPASESPQLLQSVYDTYAENIHAISVRASTNYGTVDNQAPGRRRRSTSASSSQPESECDGRLSPWQTSFHFISFMAGSGLVFLPLALVDLDWYGVLLLVFAASLCLYTTKLLIEAMDILRWSSGKRVTYCDLARECLGRQGYIFTALLLHGSFLVSSTGYIALVTVCITDMTGWSYGLVLCGVGLSVWCHVLVRSLKTLAIFSAINVGVCFWIETVIFGDAMYPLKQIALDKETIVFGTPDLSHASLFVKLAYSFSLLASGFFCHAVVPTFYNAMSDHRQCGTVVARSQTAVLALLYMPICVVTYAVYGATLQAPVFFNMRNPVVRNLAIVLYCVHLLLSYTVTMAPLQRALERLLQLTNEHGEPSRQSRRRLLSQNRLHDLHKRDDLDDVDVEATSPHGISGDGAWWRPWLALLVRSATVLATVALAFLFRPTALGIFGATIVPTTTLALILPCVFFWMLCTEEAGCLDKIAVVSIVAIAAVSMVSSVWTIVVLV